MRSLSYVAVRGDAEVRPRGPQRPSRPHPYGLARSTLSVCSCVGVSDRPTRRCDGRRPRRKSCAAGVPCARGRQELRRVSSSAPLRGVGVTPGQRAWCSGPTCGARPRWTLSGSPGSAGGDVRPEGGRWEVLDRSVIAAQQVWPREQPDEEPSRQAPEDQAEEQSDEVEARIPKFAHESSDQHPGGDPDDDPPTLPATRAWPVPPRHTFMITQ